MKPKAPSEPALAALARLGPKKKGLSILEISFIIIFIFLKSLSILEISFIIIFIFSMNYNAWRYDATAPCAEPKRLLVDLNIS